MNSKGKIKRLIVQKDYSNALKLIDDYLIQCPKDIEFLRLKSTISNLVGNTSNAIEIICNMMSLESYVSEPADFFIRGRWRLCSGDEIGAIKDFTDAIRIGNQRKFPYYTEDCYLHRAYAYFRVGDKKSLAKDLEKIGGDVKTYLLNKLITKEYLSIKLSFMN